MNKAKRQPAAVVAIVGRQRHHAACKLA